MMLLADLAWLLADLAWYSTLFRLITRLILAIKGARERGVYLIDSSLNSLVSLAMSHSFALRVDGEFEKVKAWVEKEGYGGFAVRETVNGANEHWHWLLQTDRDLHPVRCSFNRAVPELKGNGKYSLTVVKDLAKYEAYLCKGDSEGQCPEVVWRNSLLYTTAKIEELHADYWVENRKLKKRRAGSMIDFVIDESKRQEVHWSDRAKLAEIYIRELGVRGKPINLYSIRSNLNSVQVSLCPDDSILKSLVEKVEQY